MASAFDMNPVAAESRLSSSDAWAAAQPGSGIGSPRVGAYTAPLMAAILARRTVEQATAEARVVTNIVSREVSVATVEVNEAANSSALTT
jgi:hypothetical protein